MTRAQLYSVELSLYFCHSLSFSCILGVLWFLYYSVKMLQLVILGRWRAGVRCVNQKGDPVPRSQHAFWECLEYKRADEDPPLSMSSWASHHCRNLMPDTHSESLFVQHTQTFTYCSYIYMSAYQPNIIGKHNLFTWWWFRMNMHDVIFCQKAWKSTPQQHH